MESDEVEKLARILWGDTTIGGWDELLAEAEGDDPWGLAQGNVAQYRAMAKAAIDAGYSR
jgi:hypothetical protein